MKSLIIKFIKGFIVKFVSVEIMEEILIDLIRELAKKTKTDLDDRIVEKLFGKEKENK